MNDYFLLSFKMRFLGGILLAVAILPATVIASASSAAQLTAILPPCAVRRIRLSDH